MARIRSIKPEFWRDDKIADLPNRLAALFFIGIWNFADDEGKFKLSARALSLQMPIFRTREIAVYLRDLIQKGFIQVSECSQWGFITNWKHQRIDKPILPKVKKEEIQWLPIGDSGSLRESSGRTTRKDRIGSDRIGEDRIPCAVVTENGEAGVGEILPKAKPEKSASSEVWESYRGAYLKRYGEEPTRNARVNGQLAQFVGRLSREEAPLVAEFYLSHNDSFYVKSLHPVGMLLRDAEALRTQWARGRAVTGADAREVERKQSTFNAFAKYMDPSEASNGDSK